MEDDNSMSERILRSLESLFKSDPELKEFSIIPIESNTNNKSPVLYQQHCIGVESWCIKYIYRYAYLELFEIRKLLAKNKLQFSREQNLNHLLIGVLLINPDVNTFWNMKRELVERDVLSVSGELLFAKIVLSYKSKSNEAFGYRRWLINRILSKNRALDVIDLLEGELGICEMTAARNSNNYHSWTHRIWCVENLASKVSNLDRFLFQEIEFSQKWILEHVSEHTGYHYRQYLFNYLRKTQRILTGFDFYYNEILKSLNLVSEGDPRDILTFLLGKDKSQTKSLEECNNFTIFFCLLIYDLTNFIESIQSLFPYHESMWYHRRFLLYHLLNAAYDYHGINFTLNTQLEDCALYGTNIVTVENSGFCDGETKPKLLKTQPNKVESSRLYQDLIKSEKEFIRKNLNMDRFDAFGLVKKYEKWLKFVICLREI